MFSSLAQSVTCVFGEVFAGELTPEIKAFLIQQVLLRNPEGSAPSRSFMTACNTALNKFLKQNVVVVVDVNEEDAVKNQKIASAKALVKAARDALKTCFTLMFYRAMSEQELFSENDFLRNYPTMKMVDAAELTLLTKFRNYLRASLKHLVAENNKEKHLFIAGVLSVRKMVKYITGTGQSAAVQRRVSIYEREGGVTPKESKKGKRSLAELTDSDDSSVASDLTEKSQTKRTRGASSSSLSQASLSTASTFATEEDLLACAYSLLQQDFIDIMDARLIDEFSVDTSVETSMETLLFEAAPAAVVIKEEEDSVVTCESDFSALTCSSDFLDDFSELGFDFSAMP